MIRDLLNLLEEIKTGYDAWDHKYPVEYSEQLEKTFGAPDEHTDEQTVWHNIDGFKRVVVRDEYILHGSPAPHYDFVYSYVDLEIPEDLSDELAKCSGSILIDHLKNELGARCGSLTANATTIDFVLDVVAGRIPAEKEMYEYRIKKMKKMFEKGERYENDWWEDKSGDADPENEFYKEHIENGNVDEGTRCWKGYKKEGNKKMFGKTVPNCVKNEVFDPKHGHDSDSHVVKHKDDNDQIFYGVYNSDGKITHTFYDEEKAKQFAADNHDDLMNDRYVPDGEQPEEEPTGEKIKPRSSKDDEPKSITAEGVDYCVNCGHLTFEDHVSEDLRKWFKQKWVRFGPDGKVRGQCARGSSKEGKPKCLPAKKAYALGKKGRKKSAARKRRQDPDKNRSGKAKNVKT